MLIVQPRVTLEWQSPHPDMHVEAAARTCYKSQPGDKPETSAEFVHRVSMQQGHASVIEHAVASLRFICDRGITHEMVRHRLASYSQESTRYCNYAKDRFGNQVSFIAPSDMGEAEAAEWRKAAEDAEAHYFAMLNAGAPAQRARSVLPTCTKTEIVMTTNAREWLHFLKLRTAKAAHPDMQVVAKGAGDILAAWWPTIFKDYAALSQSNIVWWESREDEGIECNECGTIWEPGIEAQGLKQERRCPSCDWTDEDQWAFEKRHEAGVV